MLLKSHHEYRFEIRSTKTYITVESGHCEHKGLELLLAKPYVFQNTKSFIFAHTDSEITITGDHDGYISSDTSTPHILNLFNTIKDNSYITNHVGENELNNYRAIKKLDENILKPTFLVLGKGRSSFIQTITNYFIRYGKKVLISEVDPSSGFSVFPGCLTVGLVTKLIEREVNFESLLVYFFGSVNVKTNTDYYKSILNTLNEAVSKKECDIHFVIVNEGILDYISDFRHLKGGLIVLKDEKLYNKVKKSEYCKSLSTMESGLKLINSEKNDSVSKTAVSQIKEDDENILKVNTIYFIPGGAYEKIDKTNKINQYFNGLEGELTSYSTRLYRNKCKFLRIGEEFVAPESALPLGEERKIKGNILIEVVPVEGTVLGVSFATSDEDVPISPVKGFVVVDKVEESFVKVLSAQPNIKCRFLIQSEIFNS